MHPEAHPVVELLQRRRESGSRPGHRGDGARVALAVEGGGMRGIVSAGMLLALAGMGFAHAFDEVYASSAGAINAAYFLQGQRWEALALYYDDLSGREFIDKRAVVRGRPVVDLAFLRDTVLTSRLPIDLPAIEGTGIDFAVAITDVDRQQGQLVRSFGSSGGLVEALVAGSWLPMLAGPPVVFEGHRCIDGGVLLEHPSTAAMGSGCTHVLVLSTKYPHPMRTPEPWQRILRRYLNSAEPGLGEVYWRHAVATVDHRARLQRVAGGPGVPSVLNVAPRAAWTAISRLEQDVGRLLGAAREGYEAAVERLTGTVARTVFQIAESGER